MNTQLLNQNGITFKKAIINNQITLFCEQILTSDLSYCLSGFLSNQPYREYLEEELLEEIEKAIQNQSFNSDGGGDGVYLEIGNTNSTFKSGGGTYEIISSLPTTDLKELILSWIEFIDINS